MHKVSARAWLDGRWWTFEIPELSSPSFRDQPIYAMGQAATVAELDEAIREIAALWLDVEIEDIEVTGIDIVVR